MKHATRAKKFKSRITLEMIVLFPILWSWLFHDRCSLQKVSKRSFGGDRRNVFRTILECRCLETVLDCNQKVIFGLGFRLIGRPQKIQSMLRESPSRNRANQENKKKHSCAAVAVYQASTRSPDFRRFLSKELWISTKFALVVRTSSQELNGPMRQLHFKLP